MSRVEDICNRAFEIAGYKRHIGNIWEGSTAARVALDHWAAARDAVLSGAPWEFARGEIALLSAGTPPGAWPYLYNYPSTMLVLMAIRPGNIPADPIPVRFLEYFSGGNRLIAASAASAFAVGTVRVVDVTKFPPLFEASLMAELARRFKGALMDDTSRRSEQRPRPDQAAQNS
jgi:hypothetical protein